MAQDKENKTPNVPPLRFPEFESEWEKTLLGSLCEKISSGKDKLADNGTFKLYGSTGLIGKSNTKSCENGGLLIARVGANAGKLQLVKDECGVTDNALILKLKKEDSISINFLYFYLTRFNLNRLIFGSGQPLITSNILKKLQLFCPPRLEQDRIVRLLNLCDERIATQSKIIEKLQSLIKGLIQRLVKNGLADGSWRMTRLSDVLTENIMLNEEYHPVHSVSVSAGVVNQMEYLGRSFAAKDTAHYHVVEYGDIVYTKSPTGNQPFGIIKQSHCECPAAVSPLYGVYKPKSFEIGNFLHFYFLNPLNTNNYLNPLIQKGAKNTINISNQRFLENSVPLPISDSEMQDVSDFLSLLKTKLSFEEDILSHLLKQKHYFLREMFI